MNLFSIPVYKGHLDEDFNIPDLWSGLSKGVWSGETGYSTAQSDLRVNGNDVVLIPDNEPRNNEVVKQVKTYIESNFNVVIWPSDIKEKDINEMILSGKTERDIKDIIARNTFNGLLARTKLSEWKRV